MLQYFAQSRAAVAKDHVVYLWSGLGGAQVPGRPAVHSQVDSHAGEAETAAVLFTRPVKGDEASLAIQREYQAQLPRPLETQPWR